jgi:hypothetical protein
MACQIVIEKEFDGMIVSIPKLDVEFTVDSWMRA